MAETNLRKRPLASSDDEPADDMFADDYTPTANAQGEVSVDTEGYLGASDAPWGPLTV